MKEILLNTSFETIKLTSMISIQNLVIVDNFFLLYTCSTLSREHLFMHKFFLQLLMSEILNYKHNEKIGVCFVFGTCAVEF